MSETSNDTYVILNPKIGEKFLVDGWPISLDHDGSSLQISKGNAMLTIEVLDGEFRIRCYDTSYEFKNELFDVEEVSLDTDETEGNETYIKIKYPEPAESSWENSENAKDCMDLLRRKSIKVAKKAPYGYIKLLKSQS